MITSETNAQMKELVKLQKNARHRRKTGCFVAEGIKITKEAARYGMLERLYISERLFEQMERKLPGQLQQAACEVVADNVFAQISETVTPQGMLGVVRMPKYTLEQILEDDRQCFLLLDDLRDPGNLGTILRTGEAAGVTGVILSAGCADIYNPKVVRSTMGSVFRMPIFVAENLADTV